MRGGGHDILTVTQKIRRIQLSAVEAQQQLFGTAYLASDMRERSDTSEGRNEK